MSEKPNWIGSIDPLEEPEGADTLSAFSAASPAEADAIAKAVKYLTQACENLGVKMGAIQFTRDMGTKYGVRYSPGKPVTVVVSVAPEVVVSAERFEAYLAQVINALMHEVKSHR